MSFPEIEISKRCTSCGASARADAQFCPQCGVLMSHDETQPLEEIKAAQAEDSDNDVEEFINEVDESETKRTVPLDAQHIVSINEVEEEASQSENDSSDESKTDAGTLWASFEENDDEAVEQWTEISKTVPLPSDTVPLVEPSAKMKYQPESLIDEINKRHLEEQKAVQTQTVEDVSESFDDENRLSAKEKSQRLIERTKKKSLRIKSMVVKSQSVLDNTSSDPSLRFVIVSIAMFLLVLFIFIFSRYLK